MDGILDLSLEDVLTRNCKASNDTAVTRFNDGITDKIYYASADEYCCVMNWYTRKLKTLPNDQGMTLFEAPFIPPVVVAFKFVIETDITPDINDQLLCEIGVMIKSVLRVYVDVNSIHDPLTCFIIETDTREIILDDDSIEKCVNVNFQFPYTTCPRDVQTGEIIEKIKTIINIISPRDGISYTKYIVDSLITDYVDYPMPVYGSNYYGDSPYSKLSVLDIESGVYDPSKSSLLPWGKCSNEYLPYENQIFIASQYKDNLFTGLSYDETIPFVTSLAYWIGDPIKPVPVCRPDRPVNLDKPRRMDRNNIADEDLIKQIEVGTIATERVHLHSLKNFEWDAIIGDDDRFTIIKTLLPLWNPEKLVNVFDWKVAGEAIYDATDGSERGRSYWIKVTENAIAKIGSDNIPRPFNEGNITRICAIEWYSFRYDRNTYRNVGYIARKCDPVGYAEWHSQWCKPALETSISGLDFDLATAFYRIYWLEFVCTMATRTTYVWYCHEKHRLRETANGHTLRILMSTDFIKHYHSMIHDITKPNGVEAKSEDIDTILVAVGNIIKSLKIRRFKNNIIQESADRFVRMDLNSKLDANPDILGAPNGVFVCTNYDIHFREGRPEDFVTKSIGPMYDPSFTTHPMMNELDKWIGEVFDFDQEMIDYFWMIQASMMRGINLSKKIFVLEGEKANNSKSSIMRAHEEMYGDYCVKIPASKLSMSNMNAEGPSPVMASTVGAHSVIVDEPSRNRELKAEILKVFTSDTFTQRKLNENGGKARPMFTVTIVCNFAPSVDEKNEAMRTRMVIIGLDSEYVDTNDTYEEQCRKRKYKVDENWDNKAAQFSPAWLAKCYEYYPKVAERGLRKLPAVVKASTDRYWLERDFYCRFLNECVTTTTEEKQTVNLNEVYDHFTQWYRNYAPSSSIPGFDEFRCEVYQRWHRSPTNDDVWTHKKLNNIVAKNTMGNTNGFTSNSFCAPPADPFNNFNPGFNPNPNVNFNPNPNINFNPVAFDPQMYNTFAVQASS